MENDDKKNIQQLNDENRYMKMKFIIQNKDFLNHTKRQSIIRIVNNDFEDAVQEVGEGSYINLDKVSHTAVNIIYNIVKTSIS